MPCETAAILVHILCIPYNHAPMLNLHCHFSWTGACVFLSCNLPPAYHLHFWQNGSGLLCGPVYAYMCKMAVEQILK